MIRPTALGPSHQRGFAGWLLGWLPGVFGPVEPSERDAEIPQPSGVVSMLSRLAEPTRSVFEVKALGAQRDIRQTQPFGQITTRPPVEGTPSGRRIDCSNGARKLHSTFTPPPPLAVLRRTGGITRGQLDGLARSLPIVFMATVQQAGRPASALER